MSFLSNDDMLSFMTDIPKEVFKAMPYISVAIDVVISIFTFGIGTAIKMAVQLANEVAMIEGAYDKLIKIIASTVEKDLDLQLIDVNNVDFLRDFDDIKNNEKKIKNYSNSIPESNEVNYDKMTYAKVEEDFKKHEKNYNKCVQTNELSKKQFSIFSNNINNSIERELQQCLKGVTKKPVFKGIVAGLIAAVFAAGKALKKMLIKVCKQIVRRSKELIKKSKNVMKEHYRKLLKKQKDEVNKAKLKYDKLKRK
jgi:hypothetical protein